MENVAVVDGSVRVDWLTVVLDFADVARWIALESLEFAGASGYPGYKSKVKAPDGRVTAHFSDDGGRVLLQLTGKFWEALSNWRTVAIEMIHYARRVNRLDLCREFEWGSVVPELRLAVIEDRVGRVQTTRVMRNAAGQTVYLGSRQSDVLIRAYDRRGVDRVEVEVKGDVLQQVVEVFALKGRFDEAFSALTSRIKVHSRWGKQLSLMPVCEFWEKVCTCWAGVVKPLKVVRVALSSERVKTWVEKQVVPTLRECVDLFGVPWLLDRLEAVPASGRLRRACVIEAGLALAGS